MFYARARHVSTKPLAKVLGFPQQASAFDNRKAPSFSCVAAVCAIAGCLFSTSTAFAQATGACCAGGLCHPGMTESECVVDFGGWYFGDGSQCTLGGLDECGACCDVNTGQCREVTSDSFDCIGEAETFSWNQRCSEVNCGLGGACCAGGLCHPGMTESECVVDFGGWYFGDGSQCTLGGLDECGACCDVNTRDCREVTSDSFDCVGGADTFSWNQQCFQITCALPGAECGNNVREATEQCDGSDDTACAGRCRADCTCSGPPAQICGNNVRQGTEQCDGTDDAACPGLCRPDCRCPTAPMPTVSEWGMVILTLSLLVGFKLKFGRHPTPEAG